MYHVKGIWTNGFWDTSVETDVLSDTMRFKLAPGVKDTHPADALDRSEAWEEEADVEL